MMLFQKLTAVAGALLQRLSKEADQVEFRLYVVTPRQGRHSIRRKLLSAVGKRITGDHTARFHTAV